VQISRILREAMQPQARAEVDRAGQDNNWKPMRAHWASKLTPSGGCKGRWLRRLR